MIRFPGAAIVLFASATLLAGCLNTVSTAVRRDQLGSKYARVSGYLSTRSIAPGGTHREETPGAIRHDVLLDEATLAKIDARETCVDVVIRTDSSHDEPLDQYKPSFELDGLTGTAVVESELVSVQDYAFTGEAQVASVQGVAADKYMGLSITKPAEKIFRVVTRNARLCTGQGGNVARVKLSLVHPSWAVSSYAYRGDFEWQVR